MSVNRLKRKLASAEDECKKLRKELEVARKNELLSKFGTLYAVKEIRASDNGSFQGSGGIFSRLFTDRKSAAERIRKIYPYRDGAAQVTGHIVEFKSGGSYTDIHIDIAEDFAKTHQPLCKENK